MNKIKIIEYAVVIASLLSMTLGGGIVLGGMQEKLSNLEQAQQISLDAQQKIFDFTMQLWQIDPEQRNKWKKLNWAPKIAKSGDTVKFVPWFKIEKMKRILKYEIRKDSTGTFIFVDTIYNH